MAFDKKRNGTIELMRFVFCVAVILFHINNRMDIPVVHHISFFQNGHIGVEFFFLVSGYLMALSAKKQAGAPLLPATKRFMFRKFLPILPYHLMVWGTGFVLTMALCGEPLFQRAMHAVQTLPNLFLIQLTGIKDRLILTPEWYISAMLWMMLLLFPLLLKFGAKFTRIVCPVVTVVLVGYMIHAEGAFGGTDHFMFGGTVPKNFVRAFAEMCGGAFIAEVVPFVKKLKFNTVERVLLTGLELVCYAAPLVYAASDLPRSYDAYAFYSLAIAVTLSFSEVTLTANPMKNRLNYCLGRFSLPLYFAQTIPFVIFKYVTPVKELPLKQGILFCLGLSIVCAAIMYAVAPLIVKAVEGKARRLRSEG